MSRGDRIADRTTSFIGSWRFIIILSIVMAVWVGGNIYFLFHFDPFPFVFLNLFMSAMAAFSTPLIMMSQNRQGESDRQQAAADYATNLSAKQEIEDIQRQLAFMEMVYLRAIAKKVGVKVGKLPSPIDTAEQGEW